MTQIIPTNYLLDDLPLQKYMAGEKIGQFISKIEEEGAKKLIKTASSNQDLIGLFAQMLACLNLKANEGSIKDIISALSEKSDLQKTAIKKSQDRKDEIKIASKSIRDSHYQIDVSKDSIVKAGRRLFMVSCYARDAYLGRYLIKRNYYFTENREASADDAYDEIVKKFASLKERYYEEVIGIEGMSTQMRKILDGVISEIESDEDTVATNIKR